MIVSELCDLFLVHAEGYHRKPKTKRVTSEYALLKDSLIPLRMIAGTVPLEGVDPKMVADARDWLLSHTDNSRGTVNAKLSRIKRVFRWGAAPERGYVPALVLSQILTVQTLGYGRSTARETDGLGDVDAGLVTDLLASLFDLPRNGSGRRKAVMFARRRLATMVELMVESGMRPGELCSMTVEAIDKNGPSQTWLYRPYEHKTEHRGKKRVVVLFEPARNLIQRWITSNNITKGRLFNVRVDSFRTGVKRALDRAGLETFTPQQLRHTAATEVSRDHGMETARVLLGHSRIRTTEGYAHARLEEVVKSVQEQRGLL